MFLLLMRILKSPHCWAYVLCGFGLIALWNRLDGSQQDVLQRTTEVTQLKTSLQESESKVATLQASSHSVTVIVTKPDGSKTKTITKDTQSTSKSTQTDAVAEQTSSKTEKTSETAKTTPTSPASYAAGVYWPAGQAMTGRPSTALLGARLGSSSFWFEAGATGIGSEWKPTALLGLRVEF